MNGLPSPPSPPWLKIVSALMLVVALLPPRTGPRPREAVCRHHPAPARDSPLLSALVDGQYLAKVPRDAWGMPLRVLCPGRHNPDLVDVVSAGPDRVFDTADDIRSWEL